MSENTKIEIKQNFGDVKGQGVTGIKLDQVKGDVDVEQTGGNVSGSTIVGIRIGSN